MAQCDKHAPVNWDLPARKLSRQSSAASDTSAKLASIAGPVRAPALHHDEKMVSVTDLKPDAEIMARLHAMMESGQLPRTTEAQRTRNKVTPGTLYGVPSGLCEALRFGFISPNLPPPSGLAWHRLRGQGFVLRPRGG